MSYYLVLRTCAVLVGILLFTSSFTSLSNVYSEESSLPDWVKNIFVWFGEGVVSESELLNTIEWLVENNVIKVEQVSENDDWRTQANKLFQENQELEEDVAYWKKKYETYHENLLKLDARFSEYINEQKGSSSSYQSPSIIDKGDLKLVFIPTKNPTYQDFEKMFNNYNTFIGFIGILNSQYSMPFDVSIIFKECGFENAFYDRSKREVVMCYEFIEFLYDFNSQISRSDQELALNFLGSVLFIFYHEVGHALVDVYELPITGMAEDAVDQFSALYFLHSTGDFGKKIIGSASLLFLAEGLQKTKIEQLRFWDEHSLDLQRFYNLACWIYGSDPKGSSYLISSGFLPKQRADRCPAEYEQIDRSWQVLLSPFQKSDSIFN